MIVDGVSDAIRKRVQRAEIYHSGLLAPIKRNRIERRILVAGRIAESYDLTFAVHAVWCVPCFSAQIAHVDGSAVLVLPEHRVDGARPAHGVRAYARDTSDLSLVVDGVGSTVRISGINLQRGNLRRLYIVNVGQKLQDLRWIASGILVGRFGPSDDLIFIINSGREAVIASQGWQLTDEARRLPEKAEASVATGRKKACSNTTEGLSSGLNGGSVRNSDDQSVVILDAFPGNGTVLPAGQDSELNRSALDPGRRLQCVCRRGGEAHRPTEVVNSICSAGGSAKCVGQSEHLIIGQVPATRCLLRGKRSGKRKRDNQG